MADSSPETAIENMEGEFSSPDEQTTQIENQKLMGQIQQLVVQSKYASLLQVIELSIQHLKQRKEIINLQQRIKKELEERVQIKTDLIAQHNFKTNVQSIEDVKHATSLRLRVKLEVINAHLKSNDSMRSYLKENDAVARSEMEEIKKLLEELTSKANVFQRAHKVGEGQLKDLQQQLQSAALEKDKLKDDCREIECEMRNVATQHAEHIQQIRTELMANESNIKQHVEELKREQQSLAKQVSVFEQLQSEVNVMQKNVEQQKQAVERELSKEMENVRKQKAFLDSSFKEMETKHEQLIQSMMKSVADLCEQNKAGEKRIDEQKNKQVGFSNELQKYKDQNSKLAQELEKCKHNMNQEKEFARLKETIKASKGGAKEAANIKPNLQWNIRPKRQIFTKSPKNKNQGGTQMNSSTDISLDSVQSYAFDTSVQFPGKM